MTNETCDTIRLLLVDYSDEVLPADQARQAADHLAECAPCREELHLLVHSLELAREVWNESATTKPLVVSQATIKPLAVSRGIGPNSRSNRRPHTWIGWAAVASALVILVVLGQSMFSRSKPSGVTPQPIELVKINSSQNASVKSSEETDVMEYIAREDRSARLAASVQLLAAQPGLEQYKENTERYLKETYADTTAVRMLEKQQIPPQ
jgi:predicted anti-sigma-YlaC factor YlaD